jgi:muramoyltetrapeptide carboxypeptidase
MPGFYHRPGAQRATESLRRLLSGDPEDFQIPGHECNRRGSATGTLVGGNLAIISHMIGTSSCFSTAGKILLLEDVGEYLYNIDRMMVQLRRSGLLTDLAGLVVGHFNELKDTKIPFGREVYDIIADHVSSYGYPVAFGLPIGHVDANYPFIEGASVELEVSRQACNLRYLKEQIRPAGPQV